MRKLNELYQERASDYAKNIENNIFNAHFEKPSLLSLIEDQYFDSCLDMGCGPGAYIPSLSQLCKNITAIDLSEEFVDIISSKYPKIKSYVCDISQGLQKENESSFDLVISPLTIHYIKDLKSLFSEVSRVLKPGGLFAFSTHHPILDYQASQTKNYFETEYLTQTWTTFGENTQVSFYRRPLSDITIALSTNHFIIEAISEGQPSEKIQEISQEQYMHLLSKPQFMFIRAKCLKS